MQRWHFPILFLLVLSTPSFAQDAGSLKQADELQRRLVFKGDADGMNKFAHSEMLINGPNGRIVTKEQFMISIKTGVIAKEKFDRVAERMSIVGPVGTVMGHENVIAAQGSRDFVKFGSKPFVRRYTNMFIFIDGGWKFLSRQAAIVNDVSPAAMSKP
jgi:Domain of unknown function (DUF4440)